MIATGSEVSTVAEARGVAIALAGETVLESVDMNLEAPGELVISGRSGSGKTSLRPVLAGLVPPS